MFVSVHDERFAHGGQEKINPDAFEAGPYPKNLSCEKCQGENHPTCQRVL